MPEIDARMMTTIQMIIKTTMTVTVTMKMLMIMKKIGAPISFNFLAKI